MSKAQADLESGAAAAAAEKVVASPASPRKVAEEEDPRLRWAFVRKVYSILALQLTATSGIAAVACFVHPIPRFFSTGSLASWAVYVAILLAPLMVMWPMLKYREKHPVNLLLLGLFTLCTSLSIAVCASFYVVSESPEVQLQPQEPGGSSFELAEIIRIDGRVVLQAVILTAVAVIGLTLFTFWAAKKGYDFTFMSPFLSTSLLVLLVYLTIQMFFPLGRVGMTIYGCVATVVSSAFIVYDTSWLLKRHTYSEYTVAAISLYLDVINLFMAQLTFSAAQ